METEEERILCVSFNQDGSNFCIGTESGFSVYNSYPLKLFCKRKMDGGIGIIEMLDKCNIIALVGGGNNPNFDTNKVILFDDSQTKIITEIIVIFNVLNVKLKWRKIIMAKMTTEEFIAAIKELSVLELNDLVKACEEEFGVSAAAGVVVAAAAGDGAAAGEEKDEFDVELTEVGSEKVKVIKVVREATGLGLKEAKELVDGAPKIIKEAADKATAESIKAQLEEIGAKVTLK